MCAGQQGRFNFNCSQLRLDPLDPRERRLQHLGAVDQPRSDRVGHADGV
jgi:hypothetical protein